MASISARDQRFGKIVLKNNLVSEAQLRECLALLEKSSGKADLPAVLVAKGYLAEDMARKVLAKIQEQGSTQSAGGGGGAAAAQGARLEAARAGAGRDLGRLITSAPAASSRSATSPTRSGLGESQDECPECLRRCG